jgi:hypothetical protein
VGSLGNTAEYQNPFGMFLGCADAWGTAWDKVCSIVATERISPIALDFASGSKTPFNRKSKYRSGTIS